MKKLFFFLVMILVFSGCDKPDESVSHRLHAFYYPWYGTPERDGQYVHWRHDVMGSLPIVTFPGGQDIGADFYPEGGCYSSADTGVLHRHMRQLRQARIGVICVSWFGEDSSEAQTLPALMDMAAEYGLLVNFHIEPAVQKSILTVAEAIKYLTTEYGNHPAFYRAEETQGRGLFYIYDSYKIPSSHWARLLSPQGDISIRGTRWDAAVVGLILTASDTAFIEESGMDGGYAYFAVDGFSYASTTANWLHLTQWARSNDLLFIPSVGPGYADLRIRPWNQANQRSRQNGDYYDCMFARAIACDPAIIGITSFNEWHEGTQIEPAMSFATDDFTYLDYQPLSPEAYLLKTADWVEKWDFHQGVDASITTLCGGGLVRTKVNHLAVGGNIRLSDTSSDKYAGGGDLALIDGIIGSHNYRDGCWQGFEGVDVTVQMDLGHPEHISALQLSFLSDPAVWIFQPRSIGIEGSVNGTDYHVLATVIPSVANVAQAMSRQEFAVGFAGQSLRYLRLTIEAEKTCPENHPGEGKPSWLFIDEIQVR